jgi:hypothetical protein
MSSTYCPATAPGGNRSVQVEALQMTVNDASIDRLYCYISLAGSPYERIPPGASEFITNVAGAWNIADYAGGENKRMLYVDGTSPVEIMAECLGWQGDTLINLGRFSSSHPPEEWDGRLLTAGPEGGRPVLYYKIYTRYEWESMPYFRYHTVVSEKSAPLDSLEVSLYYSVSAVVGFDPATHEEIESPPSEELQVARINRTLRITLVDMWTYGFDGDAYGWISFNGKRIIWNDHWDPGLFGGGSLSSAPSFTTLHETTVYRWEDMFLNQGSGFGRGNNVVLIPITEAEPLRMGLQLWDHYSLSDDEVWCSLERSGRILMEGRSIDDWIGIDQEIVLGDAATGDNMGCEIVLQVQALP